MAGSFLTKVGVAKWPWKNQWFVLLFFTATFSGGLLGYNCVFGKPQLNSKGGKSAMSLPSLPSLPNLPFFSKPGSLSVTSSTPGAQVHIDGLPDQPAPATFPTVSAGSHNVTISAAGYDPITRSVDIKSQAQSNLDAGSLVRSTGGLSLSTIPAHASYTLRGSAADNQNERDGHTPAMLSDLPVDNYTITVDSTRDGSRTVQVQVNPHALVTQTVDLVQGEIAAEADPPVAAVLQNQANVATLNDAQKKDYVGLLGKEVNEYIRNGSFTQASATIATLKGLGQNTQPLEQNLSDMQNGYEQRAADQVKDLISDGKLATAQAKLKALDDTMPPEFADKLNAEFQGTLNPYNQQISSAIQSANNGDPAAGYTQLQTLSEKYPDDLSIVLAMAHLLTLQPPDHDKIAALLATLKGFKADDIASDDASNLQATENKLSTELANYDRLQAAVDAQKQLTGGGADSEISTLKRQIARDETAIQEASGAQNAVNTITGLFHTHVQVVDVSAKQAEIDRDEQKIQQVLSQQQSAQLSTNTAQNDLDSFRAQVPW